MAVDTNAPLIVFLIMYFVSVVVFSYMHFHSLNCSLRTVTTIVRVVVEDVGLNSGYVIVRGALRAANSGRRLLAVIECF